MYVSVWVCNINVVYALWMPCALLYMYVYLYVNTWFICCFSAYVGFMLPPLRSLAHSLSLSLSLVPFSFYLCFWVWLMLPASQSTQSWGALLILFFWHVFFLRPNSDSNDVDYSLQPKMPQHTHTSARIQTSHNNGSGHSKSVLTFCCCFCCVFRLFCSICMYVVQHMCVCKCLCRLAGVVYVFKLSSWACQRWQHACIYIRTYRYVCTYIYGNTAV